MTTRSERANRYSSEHSRHLRALAYRMLGSRSEADDIVQEAWIRWDEVDEPTIEHPGAYLSRLVTNLCLDKLRSAAAKREQYVGVWLPEPMLDEQLGWAPGPEARAEFADDVSMAFMLTLERLSPLERAAFLLHDVFDLDFEEIALRLGRDAAACRQLASRARTHVRGSYARREVQETEHERLYRAFSQAILNFDVEALAKVLAEDAIMLADGGGKVTAVSRPLHGAELIAKTLIGFARLPTSKGWRLMPARINGGSGCLIFDDQTDELIQSIALTPATHESGRIGALYIQRNPDKLHAVMADWRKESLAVREGEA